MFSLPKVSTIGVTTILSITPSQLVNEKCSKYRKRDHKCSEHSEEIHFLFLEVNRRKFKMRGDLFLFGVVATKAVYFMSE